MRPVAWLLDDVAHRYLEPTQGNERDIEIPLGVEFLENATGEVLEVGNSIQPSGRDPGVSRDIVCKYDTQGGPFKVQRMDIVNWRPGYLYDRILSLSTLEHVGIDEPGEDTLKALIAFTHLKERLLAPDGEMLVTIPCGYHGFLQAFVCRTLPDDVALMVRVSEDNEWRQVSVNENTHVAYPGAWGLGGGVLIVRYRRDAR